MVNAYLDINPRQVTNNAGGDTVYQVKDMDRLERFLILGSVGGTYYVGQRQLTKENLSEIERIVDEHGKAAVDKIVEIGKSGRAPKHDPALVAFAMACSVKDADTRSYAMSFLNDIVRTGTHLFHFVAYVEPRRGWGRAYRRAIAEWYTKKDEKRLAYQLVKYKSRDGWSHRDILRLAHPQAQSASQNGLLKYAVSGTLEAQDTEAHRFVEASIEATHSDDINRVIELVKEFNLPMEVINTKFKNDPRMWEALAPQMGLTALLRNLRNMTKDGYLVQGSDAVRTVRERLMDPEALRRSRIHPAHVFLAQKNATEVPQPIKNALEDAFFMSFKNVEPTNKRIMLALDVSASMTWETNGVASAREWSALQAMVTARVEPYAEFYGFSTQFMPIDIRANDSLDTVINKIGRLGHGGTDCSLPMYVARQKGMKFDAFSIYTDNETWSRGNGSYGYYWNESNRGSSGDPMKELREYRKTSGINDAKLLVTAITSTGFTIADPNDFNTLDIVGFDADAPAMIADFIRG